MLKILLCSLFIVMTLNITFAKEKCTQVRAAFDVGSGTTKMKVAEVDICKKKILKMLVDRQKPVPYKESLSKGRIGFIEDAEIKTGKMILSYYMKEAKTAGATSFKGVATSAFRKAKNGEAVIEQLSKDSGVDLEMISQEKEAEIGYFAALTKVNHKKEDIIVWDIGGGSMQISYLSGKDITVLTGSQASVTFKEEIIEKIKGMDKGMTKTPNPIGEENFDKILSLINVGDWNQKLNVAKKVIIGIGGVHYYSIKGQVKPKASYYTQSEVQKLAKQRMNDSDKDIGGDYAATDVSNLLLVNGYMKKLKIDKVFPIKVNLTDGILVE